MKIEDYINGTGDRTTFCNRIETELKAWGNMKGAFATKFGIYYGAFGKNDTERKYRIVAKWGNNLNQAFVAIKNEIISLIEAGSAKDYDKINNNLVRLN